MKLPQERIGPSRGDGHAAGDIFGIARVVAGGEGYALRAAITARQKAKRPFRADMHHVRRCGFDEPGDGPGRGHGELYLRIGGQRRTAIGLGREQFEVNAARERGRQPFIGPHDPVDLRLPGVSDNQ